jgi:carboxymethylenebutenolidase
MADTVAAAELLRERGVDKLFTVGFCFGGRNSWLASAVVAELRGAVGFYGNPTSILDRVGEMSAPILALQAGDDANITAEVNAEFERALVAADVEHEIVTYDGAPHSFFDRKQAEFQSASDDAWQRTLAFIAQHA